MELDVAFGPIADLIADPTIEEIWINSPHRIFIETVEANLQILF